MNFQGAKDYILERLRRELHPDLLYHSFDHTLDVYDAVVLLNKMEKVDEHLGKLIETAALFHDAGMMIRYQDHEDTSAEIAEEVLPRFGYSEEETACIKRLILCTRLPQAPADLAEEILSDADLDPLGRKDFLIFSLRLRLEWKIFGVKDFSLPEWFEFQERFLENHHFFTASAIQLRQKQKDINLKEIKEAIYRKK